MVESGKSEKPRMHRLSYLTCPKNLLLEIQPLAAEKIRDADFGTSGRI